MLTKHDFRDRGSKDERFQPTTLESHLQHLQSLRLVEIQPTKTSHLCRLTRRGEGLAANILARREPDKLILGSTRQLDNLGSMLDEKRDLVWPATGYWKPDPQLRTSPKIIRSSISFTQEPDDKQINRTSELRSIAENLPNLTWTSVDDSVPISGPRVDLRERQAWRAFNLEASGFNEKRIVLPDWF